MKSTLALITLLLAVLLQPRSASAHPAWGIVVDQHGAVYVSDLERVWKIDPDGTAHVFVADVHAHDLFLDAEQRLVGEHEWYDEGTDTFHTRYWRADHAGNVTWLSEVDAVRLSDHWDEKGRRYRVANDREQAGVWLTPPGEPERLLAGGPFGYADGRGSDARFRLIGSSVQGPDGHLYITSGGLLRRVSREGEVITLLGPEEGFGHSVRGDGRPRYSALLGVAVAHDGTVYVADIDRKALYRRSPDGSVTAILSPGPLWIPTGVALVGDTVYVVEYRADHGSPTNRLGRSGPRVRRIAPDGTVTLVGTAG